MNSPWTLDNPGLKLDLYFNQFHKRTARSSGAFSFSGGLALLALLLFMLPGALVHSQESIQCSDGFVRAGIVPKVLRDPSHLLGVDDIVRNPDSLEFQSTNSPYATFGNDPSNWWLRFELSNPTKDTLPVVIRINRKNIDEFQLYHLRTDRIINLGLVGALGPSESRFSLTNGYHYEIPLPPGDQQFIASASNRIGSMHLSLEVMERGYFERHARMMTLFFGVFCGIMALSVIFSAGLFYQYRDPVYLLYLLYILTLLLREAYNYSADFGILPFFQRNSTALLIASTFALFFRRFLYLKSTLPVIDTLIKYFAGGITLTAIAVWLLARNDMGHLLQYIFPITDVLNLLFTLLAVGIALYQYKDSQRARIATIAFLPLAVGFIGILLRNMNIIPNYPLISQAVMLGFMSEVTVFTFGFLYWHHHLESERRLLHARLALEKREKEVAIKEAEQRVKDNIARDLHDDIAASMSGIRILSQIAQKDISEKAPESASVLDKISRSAQHTLEGISDLIWAVKPGHDYLNDLADRIREYTRQMLGSGEIHYKLEIDRHLPIRQLDLESKRNLYLIFKEALNNALKYSQCTEMTIHFGVSTQSLELEVIDNGKGFDPDQIPIESGNGITNMKHRANKIGAILNIRTQKDHGTRIRVELPLTSLE